MSGQSVSDVGSHSQFQWTPEDCKSVSSVGSPEGRRLIVNDIADIILFFTPLRGCPCPHGRSDVLTQLRGSSFPVLMSSTTRVLSMSSRSFLPFTQLRGCPCPFWSEEDVYLLSREEDVSVDHDTGGFLTQDKNMGIILFLYITIADLELLLRRISTSQRAIVPSLKEPVLLPETAKGVATIAPTVHKRCRQRGHEGLHRFCFGLLGCFFGFDPLRERTVAVFNLGRAGVRSNHKLTTRFM